MPPAGYREKLRPTDPDRALEARRPWAEAFVRARIAKRGCGHSSYCWVWTGYIRSNGYGEADLGKGIGRIRAHRLSYKLFVGNLPDSLAIDHLCRNPACVNPSHLEAVTAVENTWRVSGASATHCAKGHERKVVGYTASGRCRECARQAQRQYYRQQQAAQR